MGELRACRGIGYVVDGKGDNTAVLFLHPAFVDGRVFDAQIPALGDSFRSIRVDLPGHGRSVALSRKVTPRPTMADAADIIAEILGQEGVWAVHIVGVSLGSLIGQDFARRYPDQALSLTVVGGYEITDRTAAKAQGREMWRWLPLVLFRMSSFRRYLARASVVTDVGRARFLELAEGFSRRGFPSMSGLDKVTDPKRADEIRCPLSIVLGEHDLEVVRDASNRWHAKHGDSSLQVVEGAGHCANLDAPAAFNASLMAWLKS